jgi:hypothetical protein
VSEFHEVLYTDEKKLLVTSGILNLSILTIPSRLLSKRFTRYSSSFPSLENLHLAESIIRQGDRNSVQKVLAGLNCLAEKYILAAADERDGRTAWRRPSRLCNEAPILLPP